MFLDNFLIISSDKKQSLIYIDNNIIKQIVMLNY